MVELADIFQRYGPVYRAKYADRLLPSHRAAMQAIEDCRTETLGGHVYHCDDCDETRYSYHSCQNRHCPKCQNDAAQDWLAQQQDLLLPTPYFILTFTLPASLREIARSHQKLVYSSLFRSAAAATQDLAQDAHHIGGQIGLIGVLHTWTRDLAYHPHVHFLVPAGRLTPAGDAWLPAGETFLLPVKPLSILFRAKFRTALKQTALFDQASAEVWRQDWVVHCKSVGQGVGALKYLAPYVFRVAISNNRILQAKDDTVTFRYTASDTRQSKLCTLNAEEFIRRFLQHVLAKGFVKVRYYGLYSPGNRARLAQARRLLGAADSAQPTDGQPESRRLESVEGATQPNLAQQCPKCVKTMTLRQTIRPRTRCPP